MNFSRIDNVELTFEMQDRLDEAAVPRTSALDERTCNVRANTGDFTVFVFARSWNVIRYREGLGGLAYSN